MKVGWMATAALTFTLAAQADFSYRTRRKTGGDMAAMANQAQGIGNCYFKRIKR